MHNVYTTTYPENVDKKKVQKYWDDCAAHDDWQEGCSGLSQDIRWIDYICNNREEAEKYIREHDKGWYDQLAVKFRELPDKPTSAKLTKLKQQSEENNKKAKEFNEKHSLKNQKAQFISCPNCSSKLSRLHLRGNGCPVCGKRDIRADYIIEKLKAYETKSAAFVKDITAEINSITAKNLKKCKIKWLVKIEYHT